MEAPPQWHCRRLPSRLARSSRLEGDSKAREKAEEEERLRWAGEVADLILSLKTTTAERAYKTADPKLSAMRMCGKVRASTVRSYVRAWRPFWRWWVSSGNSQLPDTSEQVLEYLEQRAAEPCAPSVLRRTRAALAFYEEAAGQPLALRLSKCTWLSTQADALESTLTTPSRGQAWQTHTTYLAAAELLVTDPNKPAVLRCYAFWRCLEAWAALRFSDHRGKAPSDCGLNQDAFRGKLTRTKTTGRDKKVQSRVLHVSRNCWVVNPKWLEEGWTLWQKVAPWERDYFLPVPTRDLDHWERFECKYSEAAILSQTLETALTVNSEKLLCNHVSGRLWKEHSPRAFLPSCTGCLRFPKNWQDAIGGWTPGHSQGYVRTTRRRIEQMQTKVAKLIRQGGGAQFGETELEEDLLENLRQKNFSEDVIVEQGKRFARATSSIIEENKKMEIEAKEIETENADGVSGDDGSDSEEEELEVSEEDGRLWKGLTRSIVEERHVAPKAEDAQKELEKLDRSVTLKVEGAHKEQVDSVRTGTHHAEDAQEEQKELKKRLVRGEKRIFQKCKKNSSARQLE